MAATLSAASNVACGAKPALLYRSSASSSLLPSVSGLTLTASRTTQQSRRTVVSVRAESSSGGDFNPFRDKKKEAAARDALKGMFDGKEDYLAAYDGPPKGGGGKGGGGGGGGGGWNFDPSEFGRGAGSFLKGAISTIGAVLLFAFLFYIISYWQLVAAFVKMIFVKFFRLDAGQRGIANAGVAGDMKASLDDAESDFGVMEQSVISKYGGDDADEGIADGEDVDEDF